MNWLNIFETKTELKHSFGRGINADLPKDEENLFYKSYEAFERKEVLDAYEYFFKSLENFLNEISNENIVLKREDNLLNFEIFQGSAKIKGTISKESFYAEAILTKKSSANVALKRFILEKNYQLTYSYYFSDEKYIKLKLFFDNITMTPHKIFFPLREIALNTDFDKEFVKSEFLDVEIEDIEHLKPLNENEIKLKYDFMHKWIDSVETKISTLAPNDNTAMQSFILLCLIFKIDYLITPKYDIYQKSSRKVQEYFNNENLSVESKNEEIIEYIQTLKNMNFEEFKKNFYDAKYTFSPNERTPHEEIEVFITESLAKIRWYKNNRYNQVIPTIYKYIALYILYNYGIHPVTKMLLHTLVEIQNQDFFKALGYSILYKEDESLFSKKAIISRVENIITPYQSRYKMLKPFGDKLNFTSLNEFSNSFYLQLKELNFEEV